MTVEQLIEALRTYPPDLRVVVDGYEGGCDDLEHESLLLRDLRLNVNERWYYGRHEEAYEGDHYEDSPTAPALLFRGPHRNGVV